MEETKALEKLAGRLRLLIRELTNRSELLSMQKRALWTISRDHRYSHSASINQQREDVRALLQAAAAVQKLLEELIRNSGVLVKARLRKEWVNS